MSLMNKIGILGICICLIVTGCTTTREGGDIVKGPIGAKLDRYLTRITPFGFSGACLVAKDGEIILNKGYGMAIRSDGVSNTPETVFSVGSITKQFTAAAVMTLEMQGKLHTDDLISKYLKAVPEDKAGITLHHLLTHTSGLVQDVGKDYDPAERDETVLNILQRPLEFAPSNRFEYTNVGYTLLAAIIEVVSDMSYEDCLHTYLFRPAGMYYTGYRMPVWEDKVIAHWYVDDIDNGIPLDKPYPYWNLIGNGGILSTTMDMYKWHLALMGDDILSNDAKEKLYTPYLDGYAYGWDVIDSPHGLLIQHDGGSTLGNAAEIRRYIDADVVTIVFVNSDGEKVLFDGIRDHIETLAFGGEIALPPEVLAFDADEFRNCEGCYEMATGGRLIAEIKNNSLVLTAEGQDAISLLMFSDDVDIAFLEKLNTISEDVFRAAIQGDYQPFGKILANKMARFDRVRDFVEMHLKQHRLDTGAIQRVTALGTVPSTYKKHTLETTVEVAGEYGNIYFRLIWLDDKNIGVGPILSPTPVSIPFMPVSDNDFAGYDIHTAKNVSVWFKATPDGKVTAMVVNIGGREIGVPKLTDTAS